jgi:hypothetical protein
MNSLRDTVESTKMKLMYQNVVKGMYLRPVLGTLTK